MSSIGSNTSLSRAEALGRRTSSPSSVVLTEGYNGIDNFRGSGSGSSHTTLFQGTRGNTVNNTDRESFLYSSTAAVPSITVTAAPSSDYRLAEDILQRRRSFTQVGGFSAEPTPETRSSTTTTVSSPNAKRSRAATVFGRPQEQLITHEQTSSLSNNSIRTLPRKSASSVNNSPVIGATTFSAATDSTTRRPTISANSANGNGTAPNSPSISAAVPSPINALPQTISELNNSSDSVSPSWPQPKQRQTSLTSISDVPQEAILSSKGSLNKITSQLPAAAVPMSTASTLTATNAVPIRTLSSNANGLFVPSNAPTPHSTSSAAVSRRGSFQRGGSTVDSPQQPSPVPSFPSYIVGSSTETAVSAQPQLRSVLEGYRPTTPIRLGGQAEPRASTMPPHNHSPATPFGAQPPGNYSPINISTGTYQQQMPYFNDQSRRSNIPSVEQDGGFDQSYNYQVQRQQQQQQQQLRLQQLPTTNNVPQNMSYQSFTNPISQHFPPYQPQQQGSQQQNYANDGAYPYYQQQHPVAPLNTSNGFLGGNGSLTIAIGDDELLKRAAMLFGRAQPAQGDDSTYLKGERRSTTPRRAAVEAAEIMMRTLQKQIQKRETKKEYNGRRDGSRADTIATDGDALQFTISPKKATSFTKVRNNQDRSRLGRGNNGHIIVSSNETNSKTSGSESSDDYSSGGNDHHNRQNAQSTYRSGKQPNLKNQEAFSTTTNSSRLPYWVGHGRIPTIEMKHTVDDKLQVGSSPAYLSFRAVMVKNGDTLVCFSASATEIQSQGGAGLGSRATFSAANALSGGVESKRGVVLCNQHLYVMSLPSNALFAPASTGGCFSLSEFVRLSRVDGKPFVALQFLGALVLLRFSSEKEADRLAKIVYSCTGVNTESITNYEIETNLHNLRAEAEIKNAVGAMGNSKMLVTATMTENPKRNNIASPSTTVEPENRVTAGTKLTTESNSTTINNFLGHVVANFDKQQREKESRKTKTIQQDDGGGDVVEDRKTLFPSRGIQVSPSELPQSATRNSETQCERIAIGRATSPIRFDSTGMLIPSPFGVSGGGVIEVHTGIGFMASAVSPAYASGTYDGTSSGVFSGGGGHHLPSSTSNESFTNGTRQSTPMRRAGAGFDLIGGTSVSNTTTPKGTHIVGGSGATPTLTPIQTASLSERFGKPGVNRSPTVVGPVAKTTVPQQLDTNLSGAEGHFGHLSYHQRHVLLQQQQAEAEKRELQKQEEAFLVQSREHSRKREKHFEGIFGGESHNSRNKRHNDSDADEEQNISAGPRNMSTTHSPITPRGHQPPFPSGGFSFLDDFGASRNQGKNRNETTGEEARGDEFNHGDVWKVLRGGGKPTLLQPNIASSSSYPFNGAKTEYANRKKHRTKASSSSDSASDSDSDRHQHRRRKKREAAEQFTEAQKLVVEATAQAAAMAAIAASEERAKAARAAEDESDDEDFYGKNGQRMKKLLGGTKRSASSANLVKSNSSTLSRSELGRLNNSSFGDKGSEVGGDDDDGRMSKAGSVKSRASTYRSASGGGSGGTKRSLAIAQQQQMNLARQLQQQQQQAPQPPFSSGSGKNDVGNKSLDLFLGNMLASNYRSTLAKSFNITTAEQLTDMIRSKAVEVAKNKNLAPNSMTAEVWEEATVSVADSIGIRNQMHRASFIGKAKAEYLKVPGR